MAVPELSPYISSPSKVYERRREPGSLRIRSEQRTQLFLELAFSSPWGNGSGFARNLSLGGMFVETLEPAPFSATVTLYMSLPGFDELVEVQAVVRWNDETGMGLQFGTMGARVTHALTELMRS